MLHDPFFWGFWGLLAVAILRGIWHVYAEQRDLDRFFREWREKHPDGVVDETRTIFTLRLCVRRLYYLLVHQLESGQSKAQTILDAHAVLKGTDFEIPKGE